MIGEFRSSLYDLFGYLLPGIVAAVALIFLVWPFLDAVETVALPTLLAGRLVWVFLVGSYLLGHVLHAAGNYTPGLKGFEKKVLSASNDRTVHGRGAPRQWLDALKVTPLSHGLQTRIDHSVREYLQLARDVEEVTQSERTEQTEQSEQTEHGEERGLTKETKRSKEIRQSSLITQTTHIKERLPAADLNPMEIYQVMDEARTFLQREGDREVYVYREGFYRGSAFAFGLLFVAGLVRAIFAPTRFLWGPETSVSVTGSDAIIVAAVALPLAIGSVLRTRRFGEMRVKRAAMLWFAVLAHLRSKK